MNRRPMILYSVAVVIAMLGISAWAWGQLPADASIPVHWGIDGQVDGYAPKTIGLLMLPLVAAGVAALLAVIPRFEPRRANLERSGKAYGATWVGVMTLLGLVHLLTVAVALGATIDMPRLILIGVGALFVVIGNYMPKVRPNFLMGIRTPWTLSSDVAWTKTHRLGGRIFVIEGLVMIVLGFIGLSPQFLAVAIIAAIVLQVVAVFAYSYLVWKADPAKRTA
jgi:uncharacterized membrane protein